MGIDYGVYVFSRWREEATHQDDKILTLKKSIKEIIPPTFEAAITKSAGFLCIYISPKLKELKYWRSYLPAEY
jgi:predicted RND superfamily exporter protein